MRDLVEIKISTGIFHKKIMSFLMSLSVNLFTEKLLYKIIISIKKNLKIPLTSHAISIKFIAFH
jgi:hypothetical protein